MSEIVIKKSKSVVDLQIELNMKVIELEESNAEIFDLKKDILALKLEKEKVEKSLLQKEIFIENDLLDIIKEETLIFSKRIIDLEISLKNAQESSIKKRLAYTNVHMTDEKQIITLKEEILKYKESIEVKDKKISELESTCEEYALKELLFHEVNQSLKDETETKNIKLNHLKDLNIDLNNKLDETTTVSTSWNQLKMFDCVSLA